MASTPPASPQPPNDKSVALILELLPGVLGFLGFNWIYSNQTATGLFWLIGYLVWRVIAVTIFFLTGGLSCFGTVPINMTLIALSATQLNNHILVIVLSLLSRPASRCPMRQSHFPLPDFFPAHLGSILLAWLCPKICHPTCQVSRLTLIIFLDLFIATEFCLLSTVAYLPNHL